MKLHIIGPSLRDRNYMYKNGIIQDRNYPRKELYKKGTIQERNYTRKELYR